MTFETSFFDICGVCRDKYSSDIRRAREAHKARKYEIERDFKGDRAKTEHKQNDERLTEATRAAREKAKKDILEAYEKAEIREKTAVSAVTIGADTIRALDGLRGVAMSREELELVADGCANKGYWVAAKLRQLMTENGVQSLPGVLPTYSERMAALDLAKERILDFVERGDVDGLNMEITDKAFRSLENAFSGGFRHYKMSAEKAAALLLDKAKSCGDAFSTAVFVKNAIETSPDDVKAELVKAVSANNSYWENVRELGGLAKYLDGIRAEEQEQRKLDEKQALKLVRDARLASAVSRLSEAERRAALWGSSVYQGEDGREARKIDRQGLDFLSTEEGAEKVREFERMEQKAAEAAADRIAEASERKRIEGE